MVGRLSGRQTWLVALALIGVWTARLGRGGAGRQRHDRRSRHGREGGSCRRRDDHLAINGWRHPQLQHQDGQERQVHA